VIKTGKGDKPRPKSITRAEEELRWEFANHKISRRTFDKEYAKLKRIGLIQRSGRVLK